MEPADHVSERTPPHRWTPIEDLPADRTALSRAAAEVVALRRAWADKKKQLEDSDALKEFNERLARQWCIETGIIEGIYTLDRGVTKTLIEHGFDAAYVSHGSTDVGEVRLIEILRDHERAIDGLFAFVKQDRPLSTSYVRQLHQVLMAHQDECEGIDQFGIEHRVPLVKGDWKRLPNDPSDVHTGTVVHEYCPPEHVASEMDRLIAMHAGHGDVEPEVSAAWLHHRFVQIHPFQDGNGRVARCLATLVLIQGRGFPLVVLRDDKGPYIDALRAADDGDVLPFVEFLCRLQKKALLGAIEHGKDALVGGTAMSTIIRDAGRRLRASVSATDLALVRLATEIKDVARVRLEGMARELRAELADVPQAGVAVYDKDPANQPAYPTELDQLARRLAEQVRPADVWPKVFALIAAGKHVLIEVSFAGIGGSDATAVSVDVSVLPLNRQFVTTGAQRCSDAPITFTADRNHSELVNAFAPWLERALTVALEIWRRSL